MKKLIFCCLVILMGSCKDKDKEVEPEIDYAPEFVGTYSTTTVGPGTVTNHDWEITNSDKNQLGIKYLKNYTLTAGGTQVTLEQEYDLVKVATTAEGTFTINEEADVTQSNGKPLRQKVEGVATKVTNASGVPQLNITLKMTDTSTGVVSSEEYLEFKKK